MQKMFIFLTLLLVNTCYIPVTYSKIIDVEKMSDEELAAMANLKKKYRLLAEFTLCEQLSKEQAEEIFAHYSYQIDEVLGDKIDISSYPDNIFFSILDKLWPAHQHPLATLFHSIEAVTKEKTSEDRRTTYNMTATPIKQINKVVSCHTVAKSLKNAGEGCATFYRLYTAYKEDQRKRKEQHDNNEHTIGRQHIIENLKDPRT